VAAVVLMEAVRKHVTDNKRAKDLPSQLGQTADSIIATASNILQSGGLTKSSFVKRTREETILEDETFDMAQFQLFHASLVPVFAHDGIHADVCRQYAVFLFNTSLLAKPWFYDLPDDLEHEPLRGLMHVRPGSLHQPALHIRRRICYASMVALFELVQSSADADSEDASRNTCHKWARSAGPYVLLRVVHPLKTFLADQRLRGLTPPPMPHQVELQFVLAKFVQLRSDDKALTGLALSIRNHGNENDGSSSKMENRRQAAPASSPTSTSGEADGKEHLRILYPFMLRVQRYWYDLPRLKGEGAWQADAPGRGIAEALDSWSRSIGEAWAYG
jgi:hypothetical protein